MASVGVRELKDRLSHYLARVKQGEEIAVTDRGREIAIIRPAATTGAQRALARLRDEGILHWGGRRPTLPARAVDVRGRPVSDLVLEDRR
ncbi:MAG TPA: type II toxin-antitoxin system prevent-host-death family antitoxin [Chloroflexota bacterium]|nr:type II toxin-antitoxin system prevent-host-death family antitoxin [Chloroflexota bacterium]